MCKYCENVRTGNDYCPMVSKSLPLGIMGDIIVDAVLTRTENGPMLSLSYSCDSTAEDSCGENRILIKYCPICGENLVLDQEEK